MTSVDPVMQLNDEIVAVARAARIASRRLALATAEVKNQALAAIAAQLAEDAETIFAANQDDLAEARALVAAGKLAQSLFDRLKLDHVKLNVMIESVRAVAALDDPAG